jgi:hypothetical protein
MIRTTLFALFALPLFATPDGETHPRQDWIQTDLKRIEQFRAALSAKDVDVETLVSKFGSLGEHDDVDAGFGVRRVHMHLYGGYTTIWIDILAEKGAGEKKSSVAELRARQLGPPDQWNEIATTFAKAWGDAATPIENGFLFTRRDDELARALRTRTAEALGGDWRVEVPKELQTAFELLTSPFEKAVIGATYGYAAITPPGRGEIETLAKAGRYDLVQAVLRGINPEARLYAAWVLRRRTNTPLAPADARAVDLLLALPGEVQTTDGCEQLWRSPKTALEFLAKER